MGDEIGTRARGALYVAARPAGPRGWAPGIAAYLLVAASAHADSFHGAASMQYQNLDRSRVLPTQESWNKVLQLDYANLLPGSVAFTSSFRFAEQSIARQSDRVRVPEGSVRLTHHHFGLSSSYRPSETRDARALTTRHKDVTVTAYAQGNRLPRISGSWVRSRLDPSALSPGTGTITRALAAQYGIPHLNFRAGYGDRLLEQPTLAKTRLAERHVSLGSTSQFQVGRAPISLQYDFSRAHAFATDRSQLSHAHVAGASTSFPLSSRASTALSYNYRRTQILNRDDAVNQDHNGGVSLSYVLNPTVQLSSGAGVRTALLAGGRNLTEKFVSATASAQGQARPGLRLLGSATHSVSWLPDGAARPADNLQTTTSMRLIKGLDLRGDFSIATAKPVVVAPETTAFLRQVAVQSGVGLTAAPLRSVYLDANVSKSRAGRSVTSGGISTTSYSTGMRLTPHATMQLLGRWGFTHGPGSRSASGQATFQWTVTNAWQLSAGYNRARLDVSLPAARLTSLQESITASMAIRLARDFNAGARYTETNQGQPNRVRQLTVDLVRRFGGGS